MNARNPISKPAPVEPDLGLISRSGIPVPTSVYASAVNHDRIGKPGEYPFTRGIFPDGYQGRLWTIRQYSGFGTAEESNERYKFLLDQGQTGLHDPTGRLYRLRPDGRLEALLTNVPSPNGVALASDERVLYLGVTRGNQVWRVPLLDDGSVSKVSAFFTSYGPSGPDGLAVDEAGRVIVANPGLGLIWVLNQRAEPEIVLRSCAGSSLTNIAFGGPGRRTLYATESVTGSVLRAVLDAPGLPIHRAAR